MRPRLLTLTPDYPPSIGGIQILLKRLIEELDEFEHLVIARGTSHGLSTTDPPALRTALAGRPGLVELNARALPAGLRFRPTVILNGHVTTTPSALALRGRLGVPVVSYAYADEVSAHPGLMRWAALRSRTTIAVSRYAGELVRAAAGRPCDVEVVHPGVDRYEGPSHQTEPGSIVTVARLADRYKGHDLMLEAVALLRDRVPGLHWHIVGDGPLRAGLEQRARELGVRDLVTFHGRVATAERDAILSRAAVLAMPSRLAPGGVGGEGFGIVYLEAGLHGVPSLAGNVGGAVYAVVDGETGVLVDPTSASAIAEGLRLVLTDAEHRDRLGAAARENALAHSWAEMARRVRPLLHGQRQEVG